MANQQYISIIRLLLHCDIPCLETIDVFRARKVLQAEFNLRQNGFIEVDGFSYSRQDVFEELDRPDFITRMIYHRKIWNNPVLICLLEKNYADASLLPDELAVYNGDAAFEDFFSPYFTQSFAVLSRNLLANLQFQSLAYLLSCEDFIQRQNRDEAFRPIRSWLDDNIRLLRNVTDQNYSIMRPKIQAWINEKWGSFINFLPAELYDRKNDLAVLLINITVAIQKRYRGDCRKISSQLVRLSGLNDELSRIIPSNDLVYQQPRWKLQAPRFNGGWWLIWVFIGLIRIVACNGCGSNESRYNNIYNLPKIETPVFYTDSAGNGPIKIEQKELDSIFRKIADEYKKK